MKANLHSIFLPERVFSYFQKEWKVLLAVTIFGLIYNIGLLAGPWFEGEMTGCLVDILKGADQFSDMLVLVPGYVTAIAIVQTARYIKRYYVRRFANNVNRRMKEILYASLVRKSRASLREEGEGSIMTKAILDVDDCVEGMRKFTTEIFDTGVALAAYAGMLLWYDFRLALLCMIFPPVSYMTAEKMKKMIQITGTAYKEQSGHLSTATLDRAENAVTYRVFGCEEDRRKAYEENLTAYEKSAVKANIWNSIMPPLYRIISMTGVLFILYFGQKNVLGTGWSTWTIASFTTFLACFVKLSVKSSSAAKLFNAVHKAQISWKRIKPLLTKQEEIPKSEKNVSGILENGKVEKIENVSAKHAEETLSQKELSQLEIAQSEIRYRNVKQLQVRHLNFAYPDGKKILDDICLYAEKGQIIGITGAVACGKSTLGKVFLCEYPYEGQILVDGTDLQAMDEADRTKRIGYLGHDPELFFDSVENNILLGDKKEADDYLKAVCMEQEVAEMEDGKQTAVGNGGVRLSGGQAKRLALARTLCHKKPVLILDDPFSALDKNTEKQILANLKQQTKDNIVFLISHRLSNMRFCSKILVLDEGKIPQQGSHEALLAKHGIYARLFELQASRYQEA